MIRFYNAGNGAQMASQQCTVQQFRYTKMQFNITFKMWIKNNGRNI